MSLVSGEKSNFQFILRLLNTNVRKTPSDAAIPEDTVTPRHRKTRTNTAYRLMESRRSCTL